MQETIEVARYYEGHMTWHVVPNTAEALRDLLGGFLEVVYLKETKDKFDGLIGLVDEDGQQKYDRVSRYATRIAQRGPIVGPMLIVRVKGTDFVSITDADKVGLLQPLVGIV